MEERTYQTRCGTIHYWVSVSNPDAITLVFLPGLTADHRLFDKQIQGGTEMKFFKLVGG